LLSSFIQWAFHQERTWASSGRAWWPIGRILQGLGSLPKSRQVNNNALSRRMQCEGNRFLRSSLPLELKRFFLGTQKLPIQLTGGARFRERIILSGSSRG